MSENGKLIQCQYCKAWVKEPKESPSKCPNCGAD